jgi:hypothetical protein
VTTHNSEFAELVFMLKPPGPLMDRANAMILHAEVARVSSKIMSVRPTPLPRRKGIVECDL